jgi:hypothetical protein
MTTLALPTAPPTHRVGVPPLALPQRVTALLFMLGCAAILALGAWMTPDVRGHGTHVQMGLPPCGMKFSTGYPCPTCGMTTAVTHAAHGNVWASIKAQPFGFLVALGAAVGFWVSLHGALTGSRVDRVLWWVLRPRLLSVLGILFFAAWGYKAWADANGIV